MIDTSFEPHKSLFVSLLFVILFGYHSTAYSQTKLVTGRVINKTDKKPFKEGIWVRAFNTVQNAKDAMKAMQDNEYFTADESTSTDDMGYYEVHVSATGAIVFKPDMGTPILAEVAGRMQINIAMEGAIQLSEVEVAGHYDGPQAIAQTTVLYGGKMYVESFPLTLSQRLGKSNARLIIQSFCVPYGWSGDRANGNKNDTVFMKGMVRDGHEYHITQLRRENFSTLYDRLLEYSKEEPSLTSKKDSIIWSDSVKLNQPKRPYIIRAIVRLEDYNKIFRNDTLNLSTGRSREPMKHLEYSFSEALAFDEYQEKPKRERHEVSGKISLTFLTGKAVLDPNNPTNEIELKHLTDDLKGVLESVGSTLKEINITGVASPEGNYQRNLSLGHKRVVYAQRKILSVIPSALISRIYTPTEALVAQWDDVAALLATDSLTDEAEQVRAIQKEYANNRNRQSNAVKQLPFYKTLIIDRLPNLRSVHYSYKHEVYRELTKEEIWKRYTEDPDIRSGKKPMALYEYWTLFQMEKDPIKLERLYKQALRASQELGMAGGRGWVLAANLLAQSYLARDTVDTQLLEHFIERKVKIGNGVDIRRKRFVGNSYQIINPRAVIINQIAMYLKARDIEQASILVQYLPNKPANAEVRAFVYALLGKFNDPHFPDIYRIISASSPLNKVIMNLAYNKKAYDKRASLAWDNLPEKDAQAYYLKAVIEYRLSPLAIEQARMYLSMAFDKDLSLIKKSAWDGDIDKDLLEYTFQMAINTPEAYDLSGMQVPLMKETIKEMNGELCKDLYHKYFDAS